VLENVPEPEGLTKADHTTFPVGVEPGLSTVALQVSEVPMATEAVWHDTVRVVAAQGPVQLVGTVLVV
jgi:hypothetical protein